ncbi:MAG: hypothetical protein M3Y33_14260 [Actinomycetota bacterium]|nr:hypothetical protein [Actinomycetota bacterium]
MYIDDRAGNCQEFTSQGGTAIQRTGDTHPVSNAVSQIQHRVGQQSPGDR